MRINLWGSVWCTHAALPYLKARHGRIVAVASLAGRLVARGRTAYSETKFAMVGLFESLRTELIDDGVGATIAYPGAITTDTRWRGCGGGGHAAGRSWLDEAGATSVQSCAHLIVDGAEKRQLDVVMSARGKLGWRLKLLASRLVHRLALQALDEEGH